MTVQHLAVAENTTAPDPARDIAIDANIDKIYYGDFLAVALEPGEHVVELRFAPESLRRAGLVSLGALLLVLARLGWALRGSEPGA